jgi:DNA (cytosine-5)-methyltransferase 1
MKKYQLLDLFCGAGGAAMGYYRAGFEVVGVDIKPQPHYPFELIEMDAFEFLERYFNGGWGDFDAIHASPPCQAYSLIRKSLWKKRNHPDCISMVRGWIQSTDKPYIIENVPSSPLKNYLVLCGSSFGLVARCDDGRLRQLRRHRRFESNILLMGLPCEHNGEPIGVYGHGGGQHKTVWNHGKNRGYMGSIRERKTAMGIDWMNNAELSQAIPPAYTEWIGKQLIKYLESKAALR